MIAPMPRRPHPRTSLLALAVVVAAIAAPPERGRAEEPALAPVPLGALEGRVRASPNVRAGPGGVEIAVDGTEYLALPFTAAALELDVEAEGPVLLTWAPLTDGNVARFGPPWRYRRVPAGASTLHLDLLSTVGWTPRSQPMLFLDGAGRVVIRALRVQRPWADPERNREEHDRARRWAPESTGHTTINFLSPAPWSASRGIWFADVAAAVGAVAFAAVLGVGWFRGRRLRPRLAVAAGVLAAFVLSDVQFLVRYLPLTRLSLDADPEARIRDGYSFRPELGALAALARAKLAPGDRVEVRTRERDWFAGQTMCFNLAPRPCVYVNMWTGQRRGISDVGQLRDEEIDAVVAVRSGPLPPGFVEVGAVSPTLLVGRRR